MGGTGQRGRSDRGCPLERWQHTQSIRGSALREKDDAARGANRSVQPGKSKRTGVAINPECRHRIGFLIAREQKISCGIEIDVAGIVAARPLHAAQGQRSRGAD